MGAPDVDGLLRVTAAPRRRNGVAHEAFKVAAFRRGRVQWRHLLLRNLAKVESEGIADSREGDILIGQALRVMRRPTYECRVVNLAVY
jgi:hypothetical protein